MSKHRILVLEHTGIGAMLAALRSMSGSDQYTLVVGPEAVEKGVIDIPAEWAGQEVIVDYKLRKVGRDPAPIFTGPRRNKSDRKRNKATRWS